MKKIQYYRPTEIPDIWKTITVLFLMVEVKVFSDGCCFTQAIRCASDYEIYVHESNEINCAASSRGEWSEYASCRLIWYTFHWVGHADVLNHNLLYEDRNKLQTTAPLGVLINLEAMILIWLLGMQSSFGLLT